MSVFSAIPDRSRIVENDLAYAIYDKYPMSRGHVLVVPKREFASWFDASPAEREALMKLVDLVKALWDAQYAPKGYRIMINDGSCQHIPHLHVHLIPSYRDDANDPF